MLCEACNRDVPNLQKHHVVPKVKGGRKGEILMCCDTCAKQVHMLFKESELAKMTVAELLNTEPMIKYIAWIKKRNGNFRHKMSGRIK